VTIKGMTQPAAAAPSGGSPVPGAPSAPPHGSGPHSSPHPGQYGSAPQAPGWRLRIHGAGELEAPLRRQCTELGLDDSVEWAGQTTDVPGALRRSSVFVQSSRGEGFPLALLEAMACGLPCAAFDCAPGVHEIVHDGEDGLLARPGNTSELARQVVRLMTDGETRDRMGELARRSVQRYTPESITQRWEDLFAFLER